MTGRGADKVLSNVTGNAVKAELYDLHLDLAKGWDYEILAFEIREALSGTILPESLDPSRIPNKEIRKQLKALSRSAGALDLKISTLHSLTEYHLRDFSFKKDGFKNFIEFIFSEASQYHRFQKVILELSFLSNFLDSAAKSVEEQAHKWASRELRNLRTWRAEKLIPIFTAAFGCKATVNNAPTANDWHNPTPFMVFYQRMMGLAFGERATPDLVKVLKDARKEFEGRC